MNTLFCMLAGAVVCCVVGFEAVAQSTNSDEVLVTLGSGQPDKSRLAGSLADVFAQINDQDAIRRAGLKAAMLRQIQTVVPIVVIVNDAPSYLYAISNWEGMVRFPILWDDGSTVAHEHIARFVRSFAPERVFVIEDAQGFEWGGDRAAKQAIFEETLAKAMSDKAASWQVVIKSLNDSGVVSPGIVVTDVNDSAWPAAMALSAGRMQPVSFVKRTTGVYKALSASDADALEREIERAAKATGRSWDVIGDDIDAITLALNTGTMITTGRSGVQDRLATSDRIGRREANGAGERWAYCGQIIGNEVRATYQAMCALFLRIDEGFVWDGYGSGPPWGTYDGTQAGEAMRKAGLDVEIHDEPKNTMHNWELRMVRQVGDRGGEAGGAGLFLMNSKGASNAFDLPGVSDGSGRPGHMPMFDVPFALHMVHSFSLQYPMTRGTIGGRLIEHGVFVYAGSVDEPYLSAFVPTPAIARRLAGVLAFGTAVRFDDGKVWKVAVLGDPLVTIGSSGKRIDGANMTMTIPGAADVAQRSKDRLKAGDYQGAIEDLALLGRDEAVVRIAKALMKDKPEAFGPDVARASVASMYRTGEYASILDAYDRLDADGKVDPLMQDILWLSSPYLLSRASGNEGMRLRVQALLRSNLRAKQTIQDGERLAMSMRNTSPRQAIAMLESLRSTLNANQQKMLDRAIRRVRK